MGSIGVGVGVIATGIGRIRRISLLIIATTIITNVIILTITILIILTTTTSSSYFPLTTINSTIITTTPSIIITPPYSLPLLIPPIHPAHPLPNPLHIPHPLEYLLLQQVPLTPRRYLVQLLVLLQEVGLDHVEVFAERVRAGLGDDERERGDYEQGGDALVGD